MSEFFVKNISDLTEKSEMRISKAVTRFLLYFNCAVISIWISEYVGLGYSYQEITYKSIAEFIFSLQIVVPVFIFLFVLFSSRSITRMSILFTAWLFKRPIESLYLKGKSVEAFLIKRHVLTKELQRGEAYEAYVELLTKQKKAVMRNKYWIEYTTAMVITLGVIYKTIVPERFPTLYYGWVYFGLICYFIFVFGAHVFLIYGLGFMKRTKKLLRKVPAPIEVN